MADTRRRGRPRDSRCATNFLSVQQREMTVGTPAKSATRAFQILELFEQEKRPLSLKTIANTLSLPSSSTAALLKKLADFDYVHYDIQSRTYLPTLRLSSLGEWLPKEILKEGVDQLGDRLQAQTGETIALAIQNELLVDYLSFRIASKHIDVFPAIERYPRGRIAVTSPIGWLLMSEFSEDQLRRVYVRSVARSLLRRSAFPWPTFLSCVAAARRYQYVLALRWPYENACVLATLLPLRPFGRRVVLAVGINAADLGQERKTILDSLELEVSKLHREPGQATERTTASRLVTIDGPTGKVVADAAAALSRFEQLSTPGTQRADRGERRTLEPGKTPSSASRHRAR